ncbi:MAG: PKD domain-containing protein [Thermoplasmata archaeon]
MEKIEDNVINIYYRNFFKNNLLGPIILLAEKRIISSNPHSYYSDLNNYPIVYYNRIYFFWLERSNWLHFKYYDPDINAYSDIYPLMAINKYGEWEPYYVDALNIYVNNNTLYFGFIKWWGESGGASAEPPKYYCYTILRHDPAQSNFTNLAFSKFDTIFYKNMKQDRGVPLIKLESLVLSESKDLLFFNSPPSIYEYDNIWILKIYNTTTGSLINYTIMHNSTEIGRSTILWYNDRLYIIYFEKSINNEEKLMFFWIKDGKISESLLLEDSFINDYDIFQPVYRTKTHLSLHKLVTEDEKSICGLMLQKENKNENGYTLKLMKIEKTTLFKFQLNIKKKIVYTYEMDIFIAQVFNKFYDFQYKFSFGDGNETPWINANKIEYYYTDDGDYTVRLKLRDNQGVESEWVETEVKVLNRPPILQVDWGRDSAFIMEELNFSSAGTYDMDGKVVNYSWDFGDGVKEFKEICTHTYLRPGKYNISFRAMDDDMAANSTNTTIIIYSKPPLADFEVLPRRGTILTDFEFFPLCYDPDGSVVEYHWDFGDGSTSELANPHYRYFTKGVHTVIFYVVDNDGNKSNIATKELVVENIPPHADFNITPESGTIFTEFLFIPICYDLDGALTEYHWDFNDGRLSGASMPTVKFDNKGPHWITLRVVDDDGSVSNSVTKKIIVENIPPEVSINVSSADIMSYEKIILKASCNDLDGWVRYCCWDFGDGTATTGTNAIHEYKDNGIYEITFIAIDDDFAENITSVTINVRNRAPVLNIVHDEKVWAGAAMRLDASGSFDLDGCVVSVSWQIENRTIHGTVINYTFTKPGKYLVRVAVRDDDGALAEKSFEITVQAVRISRETFLFWMWAVVILATVALAIAWKRRTTR